jgi:hypothetical protein
MAVTYIDDLADLVRRELPKNARPDEGAADLYRLYALLVLVRGEQTTLRDVHDAWSTWMTSREPAHESLRPFTELDPHTREEDRPYLDAILRVAARRDGRG